MLRSVSFCIHAVATTPVDPSPSLSLQIGGRRWQPSLNLRQVGVHIARFEACSAFTHVTACMLARPPAAARSLEGFDNVVTFIVASSAYRLKRPLAGWDFHPLETCTFPRRT